MVLSYNEIKAKVLEQVPTVCPICGGPLTLSADLMHLTCDNPECDGKVVRKLEIAAKALGIDNIGPGVAKELVVNLGIRKIYQLFDLTEDDFKRVPRYQEGMAQRLYQSIQAVKSCSFAQFIRACQFYRVGDGTASDIADSYESLDAFLGASAQDMAERLGGMSQGVSEQIWSYVEADRAAVLELAKRVSIDYPVKQVGSNPTGGVLTCVVTGPLGFGSRPEFQSTYGDAYNVKWASAVSKNTDVLVTNETTPTGKYKKALELQATGGAIKIMSEEEFLAFIGAGQTNTAQARVEATQVAVANLQSYDGQEVML